MKNMCCQQRYIDTYSCEQLQKPTPNSCSSCMCVYYPIIYVSFMFVFSLFGKYMYYHSFHISSYVLVKSYRHICPINIILHDCFICNKKDLRRESVSDL